MPLIIPPGFAQAVYILSCEGDSENMVTTMGHDVSAYAGDFQQAATDLALLFGRAGGPVEAMSDTYSLIGLDLYVGNDAEAPPSIYEADISPVNGLANSSALPPNSAVLIRKQTGLAGRRGRGRMYVPGVLEGSVDNVGLLTSTYRGSLQTAYDLWLTGLEEGVSSILPMPPVVLHRSEGAGVEPAPTPVTSLTVETKIATQRRRLRP